MYIFLHICEKMRRIYLNIFALLLIITASIIMSCSDDAANKEVQDNEISQDELGKQINVQNFFNTIPSSIEVFNIIQKTRLNYNPDFLNDPNRHKNYSLEKPRAFNLGVYGADLAISAAFSQTQESMLFLKCVNYLAQELGISPAFDDNIMDRLEQNKDNRDSTLQIVSTAFKRADKIFVDNKRGELSVLMIAGAFIESMYVAGGYALSKKNDSLAFHSIIDLYFRQKESLQYLINLMQNLSDIDDKKVTDELKIIHQQMNAENKDIEHFQAIHQRFADIRQQLVSVY